MEGMKGMIEVAIAYYERASEEEKDLAREFFKRMDKNGNGRVSLLEFKESTSSWLSNDKVFKQLDTKGDGSSLNFYEILALYYMEKKVRIAKCVCCEDLLVGPYFSCFLCYEKGQKTYDLCCNCYRRGEFNHNHSSANFLDHHSLLMLFRERMANQEHTRGKGEMEGIKKLAIAYYGRASEEENDSARDFFKRMDKNGDGKVSLLEFKESTTSLLSNDKVFKKLNVNGDGTLDFDEVLALHYMKKVGILTCDGCSDLLVGSYFSCRLCLEKSPNTYDLCCDCYGEGKFKHKHSSSNFLDHHSLLMMFRNRMEEEKKTPGKKAMMEELREIARAHYRAGSKEVKELAFNFFSSMDSDGDGQIALSEFLAFMRKQGYHQMDKTHFFEDLDRDGNGTLDFWEVMTVYYIVKSGRPFCDSCWNFIPGIFFSCVDCYKNPESSFTLCLACYRSEKCTHNHNGRTQFLDNYTLLQVQRDSPQATGINTSPNAPQPTDNNASTAILPARKTDILGVAGVAFQALEIAITAITIGTTGCTIL